MFKQILCQIFSNQCQLTSLQLDIANLSYEIHQSLNSPDYLSSNKISNESQSYCITLRRLFIHLEYACFLEHLIEYVPNLEQLSIHFRNSLIDKYRLDSNIQIPKLSNGNWFNKPFHYLRKSALNTVRYAEFGISSCNVGENDSIQIGKYLVPFLNTYMPYLQTLRLWRPDDFPWTSNEHVIVFEQDLCQLVEQLKQFVYLDIYGKIDPEKVEPYHLMVQTRFPNSRNDIQISRFSLWI
ncbi:unnamed protein product [Rotaria sp. Silwood1]|nr:unnamed protein product [Rotaria sp. Silwood1]